MPKPEFQYGDVTGGFLMRTGINGFVNVRTNQVLFCRRGGHLDLASRGRLSGIPTDSPWLGSLAEGGCRWGLGDETLEDILIWLALRDWVHFITEDGVMECTVTDAAQEKLMRAFSREWQASYAAMKIVDARALPALRDGLSLALPAAQPE